MMLAIYVEHVFETKQMDGYGVMDHESLGQSVSA
mgnify:CR=1 FL=1